MVVIYSVNSFALDMNKYKEKLRGHMDNFLGEETTSKILGEPEKVEVDLIQLPTIPKVESNAMDTSIYNKEGKVHHQGGKFDLLSNRDKQKYRIAFLEELYQVTRNAEAKEEDLAKFVNVLEQGGTREGVYRAVVLDEVYNTLERYKDAPSDKLVNYSLSFGAKYLGRKFNKESMMSLNLWTIKRIITGKTLDLVDVLAKNPEDLYSWYTVFSRELATEHQGLWRSKIRKSQNEKFHNKWVRQVPFQQIKSEIIIKIHKVMNYLNASKS